MASQLTSPYGGGGSGFDQALAGILGGEDVDQARGLEAMGQQQRMQMGQQELEQRRREMVADLLNRNQAFAMQSQMQAQQDAAAMARQQSAQDFEKQALADQRAYLESQAQKTAQAQAIIKRAQYEYEIAVAKGQEEEAKKFAQDILAQKRIVADSAAKIVIVSNGMNRTNEQFDALIGGVKSKLEELTTTQAAQDKNGLELGDQAFNTITTEDKRVSGQRVQEFNRGRLGDAFYAGGPQTGLETGLADLFFGVNVTAGDAELSGVRYLTLQPSGFGVEGLSPYTARSNALVREVASEDEIRQAVGSTLASTVSQVIAGIPGLKNYDKNVAEETILGIVMSGKVDAEQMQKLAAANVNPSVLKAMLLQISKKSGEEERSLSQSLSGLVASGEQEGMRTKALNASSTAARLRRDMAATVASQMQITDQDDLKLLVERLDSMRRNRQFGDLSQLQGGFEKAGLGLQYGDLLSGLGVPGDGVGPVAASQYSEGALEDLTRQRGAAEARMQELEQKRELLPFSGAVSAAEARKKSMDAAYKQLEVEGLLGNALGVE